MKQGKYGARRIRHVSGIIKKTLAFLLVLTLVPLVPVKPVQASGAMKSIAIPAGGFNSGNTSTAATRDVRISGDATLNGRGGISIVPAANQKRGGVFFTQPIKQEDGFSTSFAMNMGETTNTIADGFAFVMARSTNQVGGTSSGLGYNGITNSIMIEFDTYDNSTNGNGSTGIVPHIWYGVNGSMDTLDQHKQVIFEPPSGITPQNANSSRWKHNDMVNRMIYGWVEYDAVSGVLQARFSTTATRPAHPNIVLDPNGTNGWINSGNTWSAKVDPRLSLGGVGDEYYVGFTASTGSFTSRTQGMTLQAFSALGEKTDPNETKSITVNGNPVTISGGIDLPPISVIGGIPKPPPEAGDVEFQGLFKDDVQYYDANGNAVHVNDLKANDVLTPKFASTIRLRNQGVEDSELAVMSGEQLPGTVPVPRRDGFEFLGYFDDIIDNAVQYYDATGVRQVHDNWTLFDSSVPGSGPATLYAKWVRTGGTNVTINLGTDASWGTRVPSIFCDCSNSPCSCSGISFTATNLDGNTRVSLPAPTREGYIFTGWVINGTGGSINNNILSIVGIGAMTIEATWRVMPTATTSFNVGTKSGLCDIAVKGLNDAFASSNLVLEGFNEDLGRDDYLYGVTQTDIERGVTLTLHVNDIDEAGHSIAINAIKNVAETKYSRADHSRLTFYEIYVEKHVAGADPVRLLGLPQPVTVRIPLTDDLKEASGYTIFHRHQGNVDYIDAYEGNFLVDGNDLVLELKYFSEFGVLPNGNHIHFICQDFIKYGPDAFVCGCGRSRHGTLVGNYDDLDVRARIIELIGDPVYRLDIEWGDMKFVFSVDFIWDSINLIQDEGEKANDWVVTTDSAGFDGVNNRIRVYNRSNDGVLISFNDKDKAPFMAGVDVEVMQTNNASGLPALNVPLARVPFNNATVNDLPYVDSFLHMIGSPNVDAFIATYETNAWLKVATITVTIEPEGGQLTPRN